MINWCVKEGDINTRKIIDFPTKIEHVNLSKELPVSLRERGKWSDCKYKVGEILDLVEAYYWSLHIIL